MQTSTQDNKLFYLLKTRVERNVEGSFFEVNASGVWTIENARLLTKEKQKIIEKIQAKKNFDRIIVDCERMKKWDVTFLSFVANIAEIARKQDLIFEGRHLPDKAQKLLSLALEVPPRKGMDKTREEIGLCEYIGEKVLETPSTVRKVNNFNYEIMKAFSKFMLGKSSLYSRDLWQCIQECGVNALPIVSLTSLLLGLILAFVGAIQLAMFGTEVYVASLVGLSMVRIMGSLLTGIVLAGRTGASFAAIIGTMQVNEEIDALKTFGISPFEFLVLPRVIALTIMTPFLALYADIMGIIGGFLVGYFMLDISPLLYLENTLLFMQLHYVIIGLFHGFVFGFLIAVAGCYQGIYCGRNAEAVGQATTAAVVNSLLAIIISTAFLTLIFTALGL